MHNFCIAFAEVRVLWLMGAMKGCSYMYSLLPSVMMECGLQGVILLPILLFPCQWLEPNGMGSAVSLNRSPTMSSFKIDGLIFKRVSFTSTAGENGIIVGCFRKYPWWNSRHNFFCSGHCTYNLCWGRCFCLEIPNKKINFQIICVWWNNFAKFNKLTLVLFDVCFVDDIFSCMVLPTS